MSGREQEGVARCGGPRCVRGLDEPICSNGAAEGRRGSPQRASSTLKLLAVLGSLHDRHERQFVSPISRPGFGRRSAHSC